MSLALEFPGENVELVGLGVWFKLKSSDLLSPIFESASEVLVSQNEDDLIGVSNVSDDVGEFAGKEKDETGLGDNKDPDKEELPPDDRLLDTAVAGNLI